MKAIIITWILFCQKRDERAMAAINKVVFRWHFNEPYLLAF